MLLAVDTNGPTTTNGWGCVNDLFCDWIPLGLTASFSAYRNLGIRTVWAGITIGDSLIFEDYFESGDTSAWSDTMPRSNDTFENEGE